MTRTIMAALALAFTLPAISAHAAARDRVFVASYGSDSNPCTFGSPCKTFQQAVNVVAAGGEVTAIDSAGFGPIAISHSVTITSPNGVEAGIVPVAGGDAIDISAGTTDAIVLRGLTLNGSGVAQNGIVFTAGGSLTVTDCVIGQMANYGIKFASTTATSALTVSNSIMSGNYAAGILVQPSGNATAIFNRVEANNNTYDGIFVSGANGPLSNTVNATAFDSVASGNGSVGFYAYSGGATNAPTTFMVSHSVAANNGSGANASYVGATIHLANSTLSGNVNGWVVTGAGGSGVVDSYGDNYIDGNAMNQTAPPSTSRK
jgi:hypothetical protein